MLKEFSFLPKSSSISDEISVGDGTPAGTPCKKGWGRAPPATPKSKAENHSADLPCSIPPPASTGKRKRAPSSPTAVTISANASNTVSDGNKASTTEAASPPLFAYVHVFA
ncbi:hypothetical protein BDD12DRAFT_885770 [Trichophaea hybrida]|nr:hypothetical protein BDD12DRAFT_885770 [Trichophaea hybrida]